MVKEYANETIVVAWDATRCIHTGLCTAGLPEVFDVRRRPWIQVDAADAAAIAEVVARCPTGALRARRLDVEEDAPTASPVTITLKRNGPLYVEGDVTIVAPDGTTVARESRVALCRCGATQNAPFCDNSHRRVAYQSSDPVADAARAEATSPSDVCAPQEY